MDFFYLLGYVLLLSVVGPATLLFMLKVQPKDELEPASEEEPKTGAGTEEELEEALLLPAERRRLRREKER